MAATEPTVTDAGPLSGRVALITGCGRPRGIGAGIARALAGAGCALAISDLRGGTEDESGGLETLAADLRSDGGSVIAVFADLTMAEEIDAAVGTAMAKFGRLDILVNNAAAVHGTDRGGPVLVKVADLDGLWTVNVRAAFLLIQRNTSRGSRWRSTAADSPCDERRHDIAGVEHDGLRRMAPAISTMRKRGGSPAWSVPSHNCDLSCWTA